MNKDKPAFPVTGFETRHGQGMQAVYHSGLSLRDYFAAKAMQGMLAHHGVIRHKKQAEDDETGSTRAYAIADAMLKARGE